ncbi:MAG TPA: ABC transporter permease, partial [Thermoanaerobaculia bacterium]|nr:ABC transporter permease [Thermoanaerobaculia bacterium]
GAQPLHGRTFLPEEEAPGGQAAVVIGHALWQSRFGSDPAVVGSKLLLGGDPYVVVGVMPRDFQFPPEENGRDLWVPRTFSEQEQTQRSRTNLHVVARLKPGVSFAQAEEDMTAVAAQLAREHPATNQESGVEVVPLPDQIVGEIRPALLVLAAAVGFLLLIVCSNVANLLLVRGLRRQRELASRAALGATRSRLAGQLFTEGLLLSLLGSLLGVVFAWAGVEALRKLQPGDVPRIQEVAVDERSLLFALALTLFVALLSSLAPLTQLSRPDLQSLLAEGGRTGLAGPGRHRLRRSLIVAEIALALILLIGTGLLTRSFVRLLAIDPGFSADRVAALDVHVWSRQHTPEARATYFARALEEITALPGVETAGAVNALPFNESRIEIEAPFVVEGRPVAAEEKASAYLITATPEYFQTLSIPLRRGRGLNGFDRPGSPEVALINETMARRYWPDEDPLGKRITIEARDTTTREIVGVVGDIRYASLDSDPRPEIFVPHAQNAFGSMTFVVRTAQDPVTVIPSIKEAIWRVDREQPLSTAVTLDGLVSRSFAERRFSLAVLGLFAALALALAVIGMYGLISSSMAQRTHEIGIRMALGARARDILEMILGEVALLTLAGIALGALGAYGVTRFLESQLFGIRPTDPSTFIGIALLLAAAALLAGYLPSRAATKVDPGTVLRYD